MAELATLARPYANAVFGLAKEDNTLDQWSRMLAILEAASADPSVELLLDSPDMAGVVKAQRLADICGDELDDRGRKFLQALAANNRLGLIADVREQYEVLRAEEERSLDVEVVSAYELTEAQNTTLANALKARFEKEISLETRVDASLIGGAVIRAGDVVIDGSVRGRLRKLAERLVNV